MCCAQTHFRICSIAAMVFAFSFTLMTVVTVQVYLAYIFQFFVATNLIFACCQCDHASVPYVHMICYLYLQLGFIVTPEYVSVHGEVGLGSLNLLLLAFISHALPVSLVDTTFKVSYLRC